MLIEVTPYPAQVEKVFYIHAPPLRVRVHPRPIFRSLESSPLCGAVLLFYRDCDAVFSCAIQRERLLVCFLAD